MKYIDTHCHLLFRGDKVTDIDEQIKLAFENEVEKIILPGTFEKDSYDNIKYADGKNIFAAVGVHPQDAKTADSADFLDKIDYSNVIAVGECGLDYFYEDNPTPELQKAVFVKQLRVAKEHKLPVMIHSREAMQDTYDILAREEFRNLKFVLHSYAGGVEWLNKFNSLGAYYSFNGITTFKNGKVNQAAAVAAPLDRILSETDAPFLTPVPHRGETNQPAYVKHVADFVASIRAEDNEVVIKALWDNAHRLFNL